MGVPLIGHAGTRIIPFYLGEPTPLQKQNLLSNAATTSSNINYSGACSKSGLRRPPGSWHTCSRRIQIGEGKKAFKHGVNLIKRWRHFDFEWAHTTAPEMAIGATFLVLVRTFGLWTANPLRITDVSESETCFEVVASTLRGHQVRGEERFSIVHEQTENDESVWYEITSISQPATMLSWLLFGVFQHYQTKFVLQSMERMRQETRQQRFHGIDR